MTLQDCSLLLAQKITCSKQVSNIEKRWKKLYDLHINSPNSAHFYYEFTFLEFYYAHPYRIDSVTSKFFNLE